MKSKNQLILTTSAKALVSAVPWIGGAVNSVWNDISLERHKKRMNEFLKRMSEEIETKINKLDIKKINTEDFQDIFDNTLNLVVRNRHYEKRVAFRKILINSMFNEVVDFDKTEALIRVIDQLPIIQLIVLEDLKNYKVEGKDINFGGNTFKTQMEKFDLNEISLYEIIKDLENNNLVHVYSKHYHVNGQPLGSYYTGADSYLTEKGKELLELIK